MEAATWWWSVCGFSLLLVWLSRGRRTVSTRGSPQTFVLVVLGDFGRSPRMQCHALSLADAGARVVVVAHGGSAARARVVGHANVVFIALAEPAPPPWLPTLVALPLKALLGALELARALLLRAPHADTVLVQNPPAIPALLVALATCVLRSSRLVIDWHNFGYTVLRVSLLARRGLPASARLRGGAAALVLVAKAYERLVCRFAHAHLCVSDAMAAELAAHWRVRATVLHDRPAAAFAPLDVAERHALLARLQPSLLARTHPPLPAALGEAAAGGLRTFGTARSGPSAEPQLRADRPALVLTGTSWGADEDYAVLLRALALLDGLPERAADGRARPRVLLIVTGEGPLRAAFEAEVRALVLRRVHVGTAWLSADDYPRLLGCADLGVCLHASTSAVDLPMKVVDLFGAGVPVAALRYGCIGELVRDGVTGALFDDDVGLATHLDELLRGFPHDTARLDAMRARVGEWRAVGWEEHWTRVAAPVLLRMQGSAPWHGDTHCKSS